MKVADVKLSWQRSVSSDVTSRRIVIRKNGEETTVEVGPEVDQYTLEVQAQSSVSFHTVVVDGEGNEVSSETYSFNLGDLELPQPDTVLMHEVIAIRDTETPAEPDPAAPGDSTITAVPKNRR